MKRVWRMLLEQPAASLKKYCRKNDNAPVVVCAGYDHQLAINQASRVAKVITSITE